MLEWWDWGFSPLHYITFACHWSKLISTRLCHLKSPRLEIWSKFFCLSYCSGCGCLIYDHLCIIMLQYGSIWYNMVFNVFVCFLIGLVRRYRWVFHIFALHRPGPFQRGRSWPRLGICVIFRYSTFWEGQFQYMSIRYSCARVFNYNWNMVLHN